MLADIHNIAKQIFSQRTKTTLKATAIAESVVF
jgi:hypothetical protein